MFDSSNALMVACFQRPQSGGSNKQDGSKQRKEGFAAVGGPWSAPAFFEVLLAGLGLLWTICDDAPDRPALSNFGSSPPCPSQPLSYNHLLNLRTI